MANTDRIVVLGGGPYALPIFDALVEAGRTLTLVVAPPPIEDAPGEETREWEAARWGWDHQIPVIQPDTLDVPALREALEAADLALATDYGGELPVDWVDLPAAGSYHVHPSLLPKYRGPMAIRGVLSEGEKKTGVSVIRMDDEPYAGAVRAQEEVAIGPTEIYGDLAPRMGEIGATFAVKLLEQIGKGKVPKGKEQKEKRATEVPGFDKRHDKAPWAMEADEIFNRLRAYSPQPGLKAYVKRRTVRVLWGRPLPWVNAPYGEVGTYLGLRQGRLAVLCGNNTVFGIERLRLLRDEQGMSASDFVRAEELRVGDSFI